MQGYSFPEKKSSRWLFSVFQTTHFFGLAAVDWNPHQLVLPFVRRKGMPGHSETICRHLIDFQVLLGWNLLCESRKETLSGNGEGKEAKPKKLPGPPGRWPSGGSLAFGKHVEAEKAVPVSPVGPWVSAVSVGPRYKSGRPCMRYVFKVFQ